MITRAKAIQLRRMIEKASASLPDEDALEVVELFPAWTSDITKALWTPVAEPGEIPVLSTTNWCIGCIQGW